MLGEADSASILLVKVLVDSWSADEACRLSCGVLAPVFTIVVELLSSDVLLDVDPLLILNERQDMELRILCRTEPDS